MILGLLQFVMVNYLDKHTHRAMVGLFADNTRLWRAIANTEEIEVLQKELEHIYSWTKKSNATFNSDKFEFIRCRKQAVIPEDLPAYHSDTRIDI